MKFKQALITGASSGIGEALADLLANKGINLIIHGRNEERLTAIARRLREKVDVEILQCDLTDRQAVIEKIREKAPDLVVNNAGFGLYGEAASLEKQDQIKLLQINCEALLDLSLEAGKAMIAQGKKGVIMNISSVAAFQIFPGFAVYAASKAFVNHFSESYDEELRPQGIRCLVSCPGVVKTSFRATASKTKPLNFAVTPMTAQFAAEQIWKQIKKGKKVHAFDLKYRVAAFFSSHIIPKSIVAKVLSFAMDKLSKRA